MRRDSLRRRLEERFDGRPVEFDAVARTAGDLADSGQYEADVGTPLDTAVVLEHLADAPRGSVAERWNWWMGALDAAFGGYTEFIVRIPTG